MFTLLRQGVKLIVLTPVVAALSIPSLLSLLFSMIRYGPRAVLSSKVRSQPPQCLQDPSLGTHGYIYLEDVRIHYVSAGSEDKPLMLLVHGFPEFWYSWRNQLREFQKDYRVVALDQRGYGDSDKPAAISSYDVTKLVDDLRQLVTALGYKKCVLVGHDWGGVVSWRFAQTHPEIVDRFIVMNCPSKLAYTKYGKISQLMKSWYIIFFQMPWLPELLIRSRDFTALEDGFLKEPFGVKSGQMTQADVEAYKFVFGRGGLTAPINYYRQMVRSPAFMTQQKADTLQVTCPTLIIWGDQDLALEHGLAQLSSQLSVQGGATVRTVEGASHWVQVDRPDVVNQAMREFLAKS